MIDISRSRLQLPFKTDTPTRLCTTTSRGGGGGQTHMNNSSIAADSNDNSEEIDGTFNEMNSHWNLSDL
uniref:Uncharacterized protein n=1 Tax=Arundo donax TaxID=35708 RepID=A0A0A9GBT8_ARUDO